MDGGVMIDETGTQYLQSEDDIAFDGSSDWVKGLFGSQVGMTWSSPPPMRSMRSR